MGTFEGALERVKSCHDGNSRQCDRRGRSREGVPGDPQDSRYHSPGSAEWQKKVDRVVMPIYPHALSPFFRTLPCASTNILCRVGYSVGRLL